MVLRKYGSLMLALGIPNQVRDFILFNGLKADYSRKAEVMVLVHTCALVFDCI
jgi:hypothetical protein